MNPGIYEDAERLALRYNTRNPFELLKAMRSFWRFADDSIGRWFVACLYQAN